MAAGLSNGLVAVTGSPSEFSFGVPNENATVIATTADNPSLSTIYSYDTGAELIGGLAAPARRVHIFLTDSTFTSLN